jgi:hypothetical protein
MNKTTNTLKSLGLMAASLASASSFAQVSPTITISPVLSGPTSVPTLSTSALIALALLVAVVAVRLLKDSTASSKLFSGLFFVGATMIAGLSINESNAGGLLAVVGGSECTGSKVIDMTGNRNASTNQIRNDCGIDFRITAYDLQCAVDQTLPAEFFDNGAPVGTVIGAGETLSNVGYCRRTEFGQAVSAR